MNIKEILQRTEDYLASHDVPNPRLDAEVLLADLLEMERIKLYVNYDYPLNNEQVSQYRERVKRRAQREPVAYIIGHKEFMSLDFIIEKGVLIPRPETEELVERVIAYCKGNSLKEPHIVDVGTGSGAILVSLGHYLPEARIIGLDIADQAVKVARKNIKKHQLEDRTTVLKGDLLQPLIKRNKNNVDIVVSNPPYISQRGMEQVSPEVRKEPKEALLGGEDGCDLYQQLIPQAFQVLYPGGLLALEIGQAQVGKIDNLFSAQQWHDIEIKSDYSGRERMVFAHKAVTDKGD